ncbi:porin family protein [Agrobacterium rubi]|nr:porin family protein [Agrobacterium rubi]NTF24550.1 porin family protein [Agrobacterium rubi]
MKKFFLASVALALSLGVANAGEAKFDGAYTGVQGSYSKLDSDVDIDGFGAGAFGGYGKTFGNWYVGGELSADYSKVDGKSNGLELEKKYSYGAAARVGYLVTPNVLGYGIAGIERGKFEAKAGDLKASDELNGLRLGIGAETFVHEKVSIRTEVNYVNWEEGAGKEWRANVGVAYHF